MNLDCGQDVECIGVCCKSNLDQRHPWIRMAWFRKAQLCWATVGLGTLGAAFWTSRSSALNIQSWLGAQTCGLRKVQQEADGHIVIAGQDIESPDIFQRHGGASGSAIGACRMHAELPPLGVLDGAWPGLVAAPLPSGLDAGSKVDRDLLLQFHTEVAGATPSPGRSAVCAWQLPAVAAVLGAAGQGYPRRWRAPPAPRRWEEQGRQGRRP